MNHRTLDTISGSDVSNSRETGAFGIFLWLCVALGIAMRMLWVGKRELWYDEVLSILLSSSQKNAYKLPDNVPFMLKDFSPLLKIPPENGMLDAVETLKNLLKGDLSEPHPPLLYLSVHGWMRLFGNSEAAVRSLVMLMSLVTLLAAYFLGKRVLGKRGSLIFTGLLALNPFFLSHSLNLRMYAPLLLWAMVSGVCLLALMGFDRAAEVRSKQELDEYGARGVQATPEGWSLWLLRAGVAIALVAGLMTQYLFGYWFFVLAALVLYVDRQRWFQHGLTIAGGALLFIPWALWGTLQQLGNRQDVLDRLSPEGGAFQLAMQHGKDLAQTLANYLLLGHLTTSMLPMSEPIKPTAVAIGCGVIGFVLLCVIGIYRRRQYQLLVICSLMGLFPLLLALGVDIATNKNTLGFGWGRATIVVLPGCLLLVAAWLEVATGRWREILTAGLLVTYLAVNVGDFVGRDRQMFHQVNSELLKTNEPTLVVMNSRAWGHVLRLVYYLDETANAEVLVTSPAALPEALKTALAAKDYDRLLWLKSEYPLWNLPETEAELTALTAETESLLQAQHPLADSQKLRGTMNLDRFELGVYQ